MTSFDILLVTAPGLEPALAEEAREHGFKVTGRITGGVTVSGGWRDIWRANLLLRGAARVLARIGSFPAAHLAELDKRARAFPWDQLLRADRSVTVEATCRKSKIYHSGAAAQRIARAIAEELGARVEKDGEIVIKAHIVNNVCTLSIDTSGDLLHRRGSKQAMAKAPMRENMAALLLRMCGFAGREPVVDPLCGSGTFVIESAEWACGLLPGRNRRFAFERLAGFDVRAWQDLREAAARSKACETKLMFHGSDRDAGAIKAARENAGRAGVMAVTSFERKSISDVTPPPGPPGLVIMNPPYGTRIGEAKNLEALYGTIGQVLRRRFAGWRVGLITSNDALARKSGLPWVEPSAPILHGGIRVKLWRTTPLG